MYLIPKSFLSLNPEDWDLLYIYIFNWLDLGELFPPNLQILAHYI